jgi:hypothetical protein
MTTLLKAPVLTFLLFICFSFLSTVAFAQSTPAHDNQNRPNMRTQENSDFREKMRLRMEEIRAEKYQHDDKDNSDKADSSYGRGFDSRNRVNDIPDGASERRPEHPRMERPNRIDRGRP